MSEFTITHQVQPTPYTCNQTCLAMLLNEPVDRVIELFPQKGMDQRELMNALDRCKFWWEAFTFDRLICEGYFLLAVPSLNFEAGGHAVLLDWRGNWDSAVLHDPNRGKEGKKFYTATEAQGGVPLRWWTDTICVRPGGRLPSK